MYSDMIFFFKTPNKHDFKSSNCNRHCLKELLLHHVVNCTENSSLIQSSSDLTVCMESDEALMQNPRQSADGSVCES